MIIIPLSTVAKLGVFLFGLLFVNKCSNSDISESEQKEVDKFYGKNDDGTYLTSHVDADSKQAKEYRLNKYKEVLKEQGIFAFIGKFSPFGIAEKKVKILFIIGLLFLPLINSLLFFKDKKVRIAVLAGIYACYYYYLVKHYEV